MQLTEQSKLVLKVLTAMKDCLDRDVTYTTINGESFNLTRQHGICWHVFAHTPNSEVTGIDHDYLKPVFVEMGLNPDYPVEYQMTGDYFKARDLYWLPSNVCVMDSPQGQLRYKLLCDLIEYFENILATSEVL